MLGLYQEISPQYHRLQLKYQVAGFMLYSSENHEQTGNRMISANEHPKKTITVKGKTMSYVEMGEGDPIVFQHGNPTSSYLWRNVMPHLQDQGRCIAIDLIGMGDSDKLEDSGPDRYTLFEHIVYFDVALFSLLVNYRVTFFIHYCGSSLFFDLSTRPLHAFLRIPYI